MLTDYISNDIADVSSDDLALSLLAHAFFSEEVAEREDDRPDRDCQVDQEDEIDDVAVQEEVVGKGTAGCRPSREQQTVDVVVEVA